MKNLMEKAKKLLLKQQNINEVIKIYNKVLKIDPNNIHALNNKGVALNIIKKNNEAMICFNEALKINKRSETTLNNKGNCFLDLNDKVNAIKCFDEVLKINPYNKNAALAKELI